MTTVLSRPLVLLLACSCAGGAMDHDADPDAMDQPDATVGDSQLGDATIPSDASLADSSVTDAGSDSTVALPNAYCRNASSFGLDFCSANGPECDIVFRNSEGCAAACGRLNMDCRTAHEDVDGMCAANTALPALGCQATGHLSDHCTCITRPDGEQPPEAFHAFPQAEGYGADALTTCSRTNLRVLRVTSLADAGQGTLRQALLTAAIEPSDSLTVVVFAVSGTITVSSPLSIAGSCLYVAGQTAPGGIDIRLAPGGSATGALLRILAQQPTPVHDIVVRYLRVRSGEGSGSDAVWLGSGERMVLDHLSVHFGGDESLSFAAQPGGQPLRDATVSRSIMASTLGPSAVGSIIGAGGDGSAPAERLSVHHNLYAHNKHRNPMLQFANQAIVQNNLIYNWHNRVGRIHASDADIIGNMMIPGPRNPSPTLMNIYLYDGTGGPGGTHVYFADNVVRGLGEVGWNAYYNDVAGMFVDRSALERTAPLVPGVAITRSASSATQSQILADVGAHRRLDCLGQWVDAEDDLDVRTKEDVVQGRGPSGSSIPSGVADFGGYPTIPSEAVCSDADADGMPDAYEQMTGLAESAGDPDADGYTNLEEFLNGP